MIERNKSRSFEYASYVAVTSAAFTDTMADATIACLYLQWTKNFKTRRYAKHLASPTPPSKECPLLSKTPHFHAPHTQTTCFARNSASASGYGYPQSPTTVKVCRGLSLNTTDREKWTQTPHKRYCSNCFKRWLMRTNDYGKTTALES